jgi:hypothetical protein
MYIVEILNENKEPILARTYKKAKDIVDDFHTLDLRIYDIYNMTSQKNRNIYNKNYKSKLRITKL